MPATTKLGDVKISVIFDSAMAARGVKTMTDSLAKIKGESDKDVQALRSLEKQLGTMSTAGRKSGDVIEQATGKMHAQGKTSVDLAGRLAKLGLAYQGAMQMVRMFTNTIGGLMDASAKQEEAEARLEAAIKNVKTAGEGAAEALKEQAKQLQQVTAFGDEQIISAQAMLATFQLNEKQIAEITPRLLDMAAATEKTSGASADLEAIAIALGKGFTGQAGQLARYGVVLDKAAIETEGFAGIIKSLDDNFKGIAETVAQTDAGGMRQVANIMGDLKEKMGDLLYKAIIPLLRPLRDFLNLLIEAPPLVHGVILVVAGLTTALIALNLTGLMPLVISGIPKLIAGLATLRLSLSALAGPVGIIFGIISALGILALTHRDAAAATLEHANAVAKFADIESQVATETIGMTAKQVEQLRKKIEDDIANLKSLSGPEITETGPYGERKRFLGLSYEDSQKTIEQIDKLNEKLDAYNKRILFLQKIAQAPAAKKSILDQFITPPEPKKYKTPFEVSEMRGVEEPAKPWQERKLIPRGEEAELIPQMEVPAPDMDTFIMSMDYLAQHTKTQWDLAVEFMEQRTQKFQDFFMASFTDLFAGFGNLMTGGEFRFDQFVEHLKSALIRLFASKIIALIFGSIFGGPVGALGGELISGGGIGANLAMQPIQPITTAVVRPTSDTVLQAQISNLRSEIRRLGKISAVRPVVVLEGALPGQEFYEKSTINESRAHAKRTF